MELRIKITPEIAECAGLWLAEGDTKTKREITFTNNCNILVEFFAKTIQKSFKNFNFRSRIYVYSPDKIKKNQLKLNCKTNYYIDERARKPYYIYRIGSVKLTSLWKNIVIKVSNNKKYYKYVLRGFFAGEGNIKEGSHKNRAIRISQGKPSTFIEKILKYYNVTYYYRHNGRSYVITGKWNWDKLAIIGIADLHPIKKEKFWKIYKSYKEIHYPNHYIKDRILKYLNKPYTTLELSKIFNRSAARIYDILNILKKEGIIQIFRVKSKTYWIKSNQNKIIISKIKEKYLKSLKKREKTTAELAKEINVNRRSAFRRLKELQKLNLVDRDSKGLWRKKSQVKKVIVL